MLQRWQPGTGVYRAWELPQDIGSMALMKNGNALLALRRGFYEMNLADGALTHLGDPEPDFPQHRFNDGMYDPLGNFWAGSLHDKEQDPVGVLYRLKPDGSWRVMRAGAIVSNGLDWSPDRSTMYYTDSG